MSPHPAWAADPLAGDAELRLERQPHFLVANIRKFWVARDSKHGKELCGMTPAQVVNRKVHLRKTVPACHTIGQGDKVGPDLLV